MKQSPFNFGYELVVDSFAGGGGASTGIEAALGRPVDIAVNHDEEALAMHAMNHPETRHIREDVWAIDPKSVMGDQQIGLLWASPDCKHFSKAKGSKPVSKRIRGLAWVICKWAQITKPRVISMENVEEFQTWGPLMQVNGEWMPDPTRKGETFDRFTARLRRLGYKVEWKTLKACDYGAPTIRKRLFLVARRDGHPIVWPKPTHGKGLIPYRTAADCIDWSVPCPSIFERKKPLAEATLKRIARGVMRYVVNADKPFIIQVANYSSQTNAGRSSDDPLSTITAHPKGGSHALVVPYITKFRNGAIVSGGDKAAVVAAFLAQHNTMPNGGNHAGEVRAFLVAYYGNDKEGVDLTAPLRTVPTHDRFGLVMVHGEPFQISDIGMRMLSPRELARAQGFPDTYIIDRKADGSPLTKTAQVRMIGNSVCPPVAEALVRANFRHEEKLRKAA